MKTVIAGTTMPILEITLDPGEAIVAEGGDVAWLSPGIDLDTSTAPRVRRTGRFHERTQARAWRRASCSSRSTPRPARRDGGVRCAAARHDPGGDDRRRGQRSWSSPARTPRAPPTSRCRSALQKKLGAGIFGGAGVVFQKLSGTGTAWVQLAGEITEYDLKAGGSLLIHPGHLAMFRAEMQLEFATIKGIKNKFFGDSLFLAELHGPGQVWLQSMNPAKLAAAIEPYLPDKSSSSSS